MRSIQFTSCFYKRILLFSNIAISSTSVYFRLPLLLLLYFLNTNSINHAPVAAGPAVGYKVVPDVGAVGPRGCRRVISDEVIETILSSSGPRSFEPARTHMLV